MIIHSDYRLRNDLNALRVAFEYDFKKCNDILKYVIQDNNIIYFDRQQNYLNNIDETLLFYIGYSILDTDLDKPYIKIYKKYVNQKTKKIYYVNSEWIKNTISDLEKYGNILKFDSCIQLFLNEQCHLINNIILLNGNIESLSIPIILNYSRDDFFFNQKDYFYDEELNKFNFEDNPSLLQYINIELTKQFCNGILSNCYYRGYGSQVYNTDPQDWYLEKNLKLVRSAYHFLEIFRNGE